MRTLNFNHLYYFWVVARLGSITAASRELHLTQPTLSTQIKHLEAALGEPLFARTGREMVLTSGGQVVMRHADEMFRMGENLLHALGGRDESPQPLSLLVGTAEAVPKLVVRSVLDAARSGPRPVRLICCEWRNDELLAELALQRLDLAVTDAPVPPSSQRATVNCLMGESAVGFYAAAAMARKYRRGFPKSLSEQPVVLPARGTALREKLDRWFEANEVRPEVVAEAEDRALLNYLGQAGYGAIPAAAIIGSEISRQFNVQRIGWARGVKDQYFAVAAEHKLKHPAVAAVFSTARDRFQVAEGDLADDDAPAPEAAAEA